MSYKYNSKQVSKNNSKNKSNYAADITLYKVSFFLVEHAWLKIIYTKKVIQKFGKTQLISKASIISVDF